MRKVVFLLWIVVLAAAAFGQETTEGSLYAVGRKGVELGACPLKSTSVKADISGFISRVRVRQEFENSYAEPIEAVYVFPLSQNGAVDAMTMTVGTRVIRGKIMKREEARTTYETAKSEGKTASLLDQERPNIFTQSVANIMPGEKVIVEISYVETLKYEDGAYEFVFPMTVGPRYVPGSVKDAAKIKPPIAETRNGSDISIEVNLNAGVPVEEIRSTSHQLDQVNFSPNTSKVTLRGEKTIPNKDFILRYDVTGKRIEDAILVHRDKLGGFFTMILQPPDKIASEDRTPKEIVFVLDTSGSMSGFPIEKAKEAMKLSLEGLYPDDTFNLITFAGDTHILFEKPVPATRANLDAAQAFLDTREGGGGTEMMKAIKAALEASDAAGHLRIVCFMTDGYIGNENEIIAEIQKHPKARVFSFGIGNSVNRFLLDKMALEGKGEAEYVSVTDDGSKAARKFYERVRSPLLTDLSIDWNGLPVADVYPGRLTDLFSAKPVILHGRYTKGMSGTIKLKGKVAGQEYVRNITVNLPDTETANGVLSTLWARTRIDELSSARLKAPNQKLGDELDGQITNIGLEFGLLTSFTSFVAVEDRVVNSGGSPTTVEVPVERPDGTADPNSPVRKLEVLTSLSRPPAAKATGGGGGGGNQVANLPVNARTTSQLMTMSAGVLNSTNSVVQVTADSPMIDTTSSSVTTVIRPDGTGRRQPPRGKSRSSTKTAKGSGGGTGHGSGDGYGSGSGIGDGTSRSETTFVVDGTETANFRTGALNSNNGMAKTVSGGVLNGRAISLTKPDYPQAALAVAAKGAVSVLVTIDKSGAVASAAAVSGHPLLRAAAEKAALSSRFAPTSLGGMAVTISGVIVYNFADAGAASTTIEKMKVGPLSPAEKKQLILSEKLHIWLYAIVERLAKGETNLSPNEARFVRDGKADLRIYLTTMSPTVVAKLKAAGVEVISENGSTVVGRISIEKLIALAEIEEVKLVLPKI